MKISFSTALCHVLALIAPAIRLRAFLDQHKNLNFISSLLISEQDY